MKNYGTKSKNIIRSTTRNSEKLNEKYMKIKFIMVIVFRVVFHEEKKKMLTSSFLRRMFV